MSTHKINPNVRKKVLTIFAAISMFIGVALGGSAAAFAATGTGHFAGYIWNGDGTSFLGSYAFSDGTAGFCMDAPLGPPVSFVYNNGVVSSFTRGDGTTVDANDMARLAYFAVNYGGSNDPTVAAAVQLNVWRITGMNGHTDAYYAARANGQAGAVIAEADAQLAAADANASTGVTATVSVTNDDATATTATAVSDLSVSYVNGTNQTVMAGTNSGTMTITGGVFTDNGTASHAITNGQSLSITPDRNRATIGVTASVSYTNLPYGNSLVVGEPVAPSRQRILFGGQSSATDVAASSSTQPIAGDHPFQVQVATQTSAANGAIGDSVTDQVVVSVQSSPTNVNGEWGVYDNAGTLTPVPVTIHATYWQDNSGGPVSPTPTVPTTAVNECEVTLNVTAAGTYTSPPCTIAKTGYHVWTEQIVPSDTSPAQGGDKVLAYQSEYGTSTETTFVPFAPTISTHISSASVAPGACLQDNLHITNSNSATTNPYDIKSTLIGPFTTQPVAGTVLPDLTGQPIAGVVTTTVTGNGDFITPCVTAAAAGYYFWVLDSTGTSASDGIIPAFTDYQIYATESAISVLPTVTPTRLATTGVDSTETQTQMFFAILFFSAGLFALMVSSVFSSRRKEELV